jgi:hypothetical protein
MWIGLDSGYEICAEWIRAGRGVARQKHLPSARPVVRDEVRLQGPHELHHPPRLFQGLPVFAVELRSVRASLLGHEGWQANQICYVTARCGVEDLDVHPWLACPRNMGEGTRRD